jgi:O-antigen ligase
MTELSVDLAKPTRTGNQLIYLVVACLFLFALWQTSGFSLNLSYQTYEATSSEVIEGLAERAAGQADTINILMWGIFASIAILLQFLRKKHALFTWARAWPLMLLLVLIVLSGLWSAVPDIAFRRAIKHLLLMSILAGVVIGARSPGEILRLAIFFTGLIMVANVASVVLIPGVAIDTSGALRGLHGHKNIAGPFTMITIFVWFWAARWSRGIFMRTILFSGTLLWVLFLLGTDSRTSIGSTILAVVVIFPVRHVIGKPVFVVICGLATSFLVLFTIYLAILLDVSFSDILDFLQGQRTTLTGRFKVWEIAYESFLNHRALGAGFGSLWSTGPSAPALFYGNAPPTRFLLGLTHAHNGYIDLLATLGIVGAVFFLIFLGSVFVVLIKAFKPENVKCFPAPLAEICGCIFFAILIQNITKTTFFTQNIVWSSFIFCYLLLCSARSSTDAKSASVPERARPTRLCQNPYSGVPT